jgi:hypothetical protein
MPSFYSTAPQHKPLPGVFFFLFKADDFTCVPPLCLCLGGSPTPALRSLVGADASVAADQRWTLVSTVEWGDCGGG